MVRYVIELSAEHKTETARFATLVSLAARLTELDEVGAKVISIRREETKSLTPEELQALKVLTPIDEQTLETLGLPHGP